MELGSYKQIFFSNNKSVWLGNGKYGCQQYFLTHVSKKKKKERTFKLHKSNGSAFVCRIK